MAGNQAEPHNSVPAVTDEMPRTDLIDVEEITCIAAKKLDTKCIIMGEQLTDLKINVTQQL